MNTVKVKITFRFFADSRGLTHTVSADDVEAFLPSRPTDQEQVTLITKEQAKEIDDEHEQHLVQIFTGGTAEIITLFTFTAHVSDEGIVLVSKEFPILDGEEEKVATVIMSWFVKFGHIRRLQKPLKVERVPTA